MEGSACFLRERIPEGWCKLVKLEEHCIAAYIGLCPFIMHAMEGLNLSPLGVRQH